MREQISLNGTWQLKGTASYVPLRDKSMETGKPLEGVTGWMDAQVPGGVARALYQAGYIDHPYVDMNSLKCDRKPLVDLPPRVRPPGYPRTPQDPPALRGRRLCLHGLPERASAGRTRGHV